MAEDTSCPECGARIDPESPCSACLMKLGLSGTAVGPATNPPERIGPYHLLRRLGEGGMGEVWEADQEEPLRRKVAVKLIKPGMDTRQVIARFESERQALAVMSHPNVAQVFDAGSTREGRPYFVMEYVEGVPITSYCDRNRLSTRHRLELFTHVCEGIQHAHQKGIIHRDLKPSNILVTEQNDRPVPKIIDFGVAKATAQRETERSLFTDYGQVVGTPEYMSPEQAELSQHDIDTRTDIYSLGIVLYELLVGSLPFDPKELRQAAFDEIRRVIREEVPSRPSTRISTLGELSFRSAERRRTDARTLARQLRGDLDWITMKALEKDRSRRYGTVGEFGADISRYLRSEPVEAGPPGLLYRSRKFVDRHRLGVTLVVAAFALVAGFAVRESMQARRIATERDTAKEVSDFLVNLFQVSDPGESRGETITAREILDRGAEKIEKDLADRPLVRGRLMTVLGMVYHKLGLYEKAQPLLEDSLGSLRRERGADHHDTLSAMDSLGYLLLDRGKLKEAEQYVSEALEGRRRVLGNDHEHTLASVGHMAVILKDQGRLDEAEAYYHEAVESRRRTLGEDHPATLGAMHNMAGFLLNKGNLEEAEALARETLERYRRIMGNDHPDTLRMVGTLGMSLRGQDRLEEAEPYYREILEGTRRVLGEDHPEVLVSLNNYAGLLYSQAKYEEAAEQFKELLAAIREKMGEDHPNTLSLVFNVGAVIEVLGDLEEAERYYRQALKGRRRILGEDHPQTLLSLAAEAKILRRLGRLEEAETMARDALAGHRRVLGDDHPMTLFALQTYGFVLWDLGKYRETGRIFREVVERRRAKLGDDHQDTVRAVGYLAGILWDLKEYTESEKYYLEVLESLRSDLGDDHSRTRGVVIDLVDLYEEWGKAEKAAEWRDRFPAAFEEGGD